ncbi:MAG: hypothetical protein SF162_16120 [bacterium]|nr:hypothetical protein [bacterium]
MPVLLLSRGDPKSKDVLRRALTARYGIGAPALDTLCIAFTGRTRLKVGPITTWVPVEGRVRFRFPFAASWEYTVRPAGLPLHHVRVAFDGSRICRQQPGKPPVADDNSSVNAMRQQVWANTTALLCPLSGSAIELKAVNDHRLVVTHTEHGTHVAMQLNPDYTVSAIETSTTDPADGIQKPYRLEFSGGQRLIDGLMLPHTITMYWGDEIDCELHPVRADINPEIDDSAFQIA